MIPPVQLPQPGEVFSVFELNRSARQMLEGTFPMVWVMGELSNVVKPRSGHLYFSLKDEKAQIRCAMFKMANQSLNFTPQEGQAVLIKAKLSLYEGRGDFQLIIQSMEISGEGRLRQAFEQLKAKLFNEGVFSAPKKTLSLFPKHIGIISSPTGAAVHDILTTLKQRYPIANVWIYPCMVQGKQAAPTIVQAIDTANQHSICDVLIVARGGGSLEDLWPFNEETVARALYASQIPIVSGVGHEVDVTICDFVADHRAPTPTGAAQRVTPVAVEQIEHFESFKRRLVLAIEKQVLFLGQRLDGLEKRVQHPSLKINTLQKQFIDIEKKLALAITLFMANQKKQFHLLAHTFKHLSPVKDIELKHKRLKELYGALKNAMNTVIERAYHSLDLSSKQLNTLSPLSTLKRGFSITASLEAPTKMLRRAQDCQVGQKVNTQLASGHLICKIEKIIE